MKIYHEHSRHSFDKFAVERGYQRTQRTDIGDQILTIPGRLLGVLPISRKFEFKGDDRRKIIKGTTGPRFTQAYLETLEQDQGMAGRIWVATIIQRNTIKGSKTTQTYILDWLDEKR